MKIKEFGVEMWMNEFENHCDFNLAETCVASITLKDLIAFSGQDESKVWSDLMAMKMNYGDIKGSDRLRDNICDLYTKQKRENILITHGTISANALLHETLVEPGDHIISVKPTYQQHYSIPESYGADVSVLDLREENQFLPDLDELRSMTKSGTKLIAINNPNNPTGALMDEELLIEIVKIARECDAYLLCDEVYRGTDQVGSGSTTGIVDLYEKGISTGGMSKAFSLAGLRIGWIAASEDTLAAVSIHRDYNTISVGMVNDYFASMALESKDKILARSQTLTRKNLEILDAWVQSEPAISYVKPKSATVALLNYDFEMSSRDFCIQLLEGESVMLTPGSALDMEGYLRIGYANDTGILEEGLRLMSRFLKRVG